MQLELLLAFIQVMDFGAKLLQQFQHTTSFSICQYSH